MDNNEKHNPHKNHRERMKQKIIDNGPEQFNDHEILEIMLYYALPRIDTNEIAHGLLDRFGSLKKILQASEKELEQVDKIGRAAAIMIKVMGDIYRRADCEIDPRTEFTTLDSIANHVLKLYKNQITEKLMLLLFDKKGRIERTLTVGEGNLDILIPNFRKLLSAIPDSAYTAVLAHNHPSGLLMPSYNDRKATVELELLLDAIGVRLIEHFIVSDGKYVGIKTESYSVKNANEPISKYML